MAVMDTESRPRDGRRGQFSVRHQPPYVGILDESCRLVDMVERHRP